MGSLKSYVEAFDPRLGQINASSPRVSIIVTNFNYADYIRDALQSVSLQTYPAVECIIVDDCSRDDSVACVEQFIRSDTSPIKFTLIRHDSTQGQYAAFRTGLEQATGAFVAFLDADDLLLPDFVSEHVRVHLSWPPAAFTSSNQYQIDSGGQIIGGHHPDLATQSTYKRVDTVSLRRSFWVWATTSSMMFRRSVLDYIMGDADEAFKKCADNYVCHFADLLGGSILIPKVLGCYRRHQRNTFSNNPLVGGRLPTGDMRHHPTHKLVSDHVRSRLLELNQRFIALLGATGFFHLLARVTSLRQLWRTGRAIRRMPGFGFRELLAFAVIFGWLNLRTLARALKGRDASYTMHDLDGVKRGANVAVYTDYQRHRRDAK